MICLIPKVTSTFLAKTSRTVNNCGGYENCGKLSTKSEVTVNRCRGNGYFFKKRQKSSTCRAIPLWKKSHFSKPFLSKVQKSKLTIFFFHRPQILERKEEGLTPMEGEGEVRPSQHSYYTRRAGRPLTIRATSHTHSQPTPMASQPQGPSQG